MSIHVFLLLNQGDRVGIPILPWKDIFNFQSGLGCGVSKTHFYFLISLLFHRWFNKPICSGVCKAGSLFGAKTQLPGPRVVCKSPWS